MATNRVKASEYAAAYKELGNINAVCDRFGKDRTTVISALDRAGVEVTELRRRSARSLPDVTAAKLIKALNESDNQFQAAKSLKIDRRDLTALIKSHNITSRVMYEAPKASK